MNHTGGEPFDSAQGKHTSPKDVFLNLLAIITLYVSAGSFLTLLFQFINLYFPDPLTDFEYVRSGAFSTLRWSLAILVIVFPVYAGTTWSLAQGFVRLPSKRSLNIRKWLIYFTLFAASVIIIGDLVVLVYNLLSGELTIRFLLKIAAVFLVAGATFWYYFWEVRNYQVE